MTKAVWTRVADVILMIKCLNWQLPYIQGGPKTGLFLSSYLLYMLTQKEDPYIIIQSYIVS